MSIPVYQVDAFADRPFGGNPAAICWLDQDKSDDWRQSVAAEMNLSETAFIEGADSGFGLRWFTPAAEVDLCGHATLAAAHVLWETNRVQADRPIVFQSRSGPLTAVRSGSNIQLDFPATPTEPCPAPNDLAEALGLEPGAIEGCHRSRFDLVVELASDRAVGELAPNFAKLAEVDIRGVIVTSEARSAEFADVDFVSRFFAPRFGVNEDPVTGSAHCSLGPFWKDRLGKSRFVGRQLSARGGTVLVELIGDRALLSGSAVTVFVGELQV